MNATARTRKPAAAPKPAYKPRLQPLDIEEGVLAVQSESDPTKYYITNGKTGACNCKSAFNRPHLLCKHGKISMSVWPHLMNRRSAALHPAPVALVPVVPEPELREPISLDAYRGAAGLMEAFGL